MAECDLVFQMGKASATLHVYPYRNVWYLRRKPAIPAAGGERIDWRKRIAQFLKSVPSQESRELVTKRERMLMLPKVQSDELHDGSQKPNLQLDTTEFSEQDWGRCIRLSFASNSDVLWGLIDDNDAFPDLLASTQLSMPDSALATQDFSGPVAINSPFPDKFERKGRRLNIFLEILKNAAVRDLSLTEVYDSVKL